MLELGPMARAGNSKQHLHWLSAFVVIVSCSYEKKRKELTEAWGAASIRCRERPSDASGIGRGPGSHGIWCGGTTAGSITWAWEGPAAAGA